MNEQVIIDMKEGILSIYSTAKGNQLDVLARTTLMIDLGAKGLLEKGRPDAILQHATEISLRPGIQAPSPEEVQHLSLHSDNGG